MGTLKPEWLSALIEESFNARMIPAADNDEETAVEILPEFLDELQKDSFISGKKI